MSEWSCPALERRPSGRVTDVTVVSGFLAITCNNHSLADKDAPLSVSGSLRMLASSDQEHAFGKEPELLRAECSV
jgi:hypothetical protein